LIYLVLVPHPTNQQTTRQLFAQTLATRVHLHLGWLFVDLHGSTNCSLVRTQIATFDQADSGAANIEANRCALSLRATFGRSFNGSKSGHIVVLAVGVGNDTVKASAMSRAVATGGSCTPS